MSIIMFVIGMWVGSIISVGVLLLFQGSRDELG